MDVTQLQTLANKTRSGREAGVGILLCSLVLAIFYFIPLESAPASSAPAAVAAAEQTPFPPVIPNAQAAIVYDLATQKTLYDLNADAQLPIGPLTQLIALEGSALHQPTNQVPQALGLAQTYTLNDTGTDLSVTQAGAYGSAHDMALLIARALTDVSQVPNKNSIPGVSPLLSLSGATPLAGSVEAFAFDAGINHPIVVVLLGDTNKGLPIDSETLVNAVHAYFAHP